MAHTPTRVVVTGIGLVTGLGIGRETTWRRLREGHCAVRALEPLAEGEAPPFGCRVPQDDQRPSAHWMKAAIEAKLDARVPHGYPADRDRAATIISLGKGDLLRRQTAHARLIAFGPAEAEESLRNNWLNTWPNSAAAAAARANDFRGPCLAPVAACATGVIAVLQAADLIRRGVCDLALAGSGDSQLEPLVVAAFRRMRVLARAEGDPARAVRPWDRGRSGFVPGEGAAVLVLEREDHSRGRGAIPYAELAGGMFGSDAYHETDLNPDPSGLADLIVRALAHARIAPEEIDHVNVHGTATEANDPLECRALRLALGAHAERVSCSANKAQIGHLLSGAGSAELAITCLALRDQFVPPTLNLTDPDPACDLDGTPHVGRSRPIRAALKLSIGFGGHLAAAVLRQVDGPRRSKVPT